MAAPHPRLRKALSAPGLLRTIHESFASVPDPRGARVEIALGDALMAGLAVFGLKYPSLLKFDEASREDVIRHNLRTLYGVERAPCDTQLRTILDPVAPEHLRPAFRAVHRELQRHKALEAYRYLDGYYLVSVDGTGQFASSEIRLAAMLREDEPGPGELLPSITGGGAGAPGTQDRAAASG
jgi:hypothetical protein